MPCIAPSRKRLRHRASPATGPWLRARCFQFLVPGSKFPAFVVPRGSEFTVRGSSLFRVLMFRVRQRTQNLEPWSLERRIRGTRNNEPRTVGTRNPEFPELGTRNSRNLEPGTGNLELQGSSARSLHSYSGSVSEHLGHACRDFIRVVASADDGVRARLGRVLQHQSERIFSGALA